METDKRSRVCFTSYLLHTHVYSVVYYLIVLQMMAIFVLICLQDEYFKKWILGHLQGAFKSMRSDNSATITPLSLYRYLKNMNYKPRKGEIEEAIWEVDEDHDGEVCWEEFLRAFIRCIHDEKGVEPHQLHNIVLFSIFSDGTPVISDVNIRRMMHLKHGPVRNVENMTVQRYVNCAVYGLWSLM